MTKYDLFVFSPKSSQETVYLNIYVKLMKLFQSRLNRIGFSNVIVDTMWYHPDVELTLEEETVLSATPLFLSEHWLAKPLILDPTQELNVMHTRRTPWQMRPDIKEYHYVDCGKRPKLHVAFAGNYNSGKTWLIHEFSQMVKELAPEAVIIKCDHPDSNQDHWDCTSDPEFMHKYFEHIRDHAICLGNGPSTRMNLDNMIEHNTRL